ncbi:hypothetical protein [Methylobacter sp. BBA5.1]|uniref:hypothetical protein n=1 Tax=Methylobacter sp. BBA5.1 TaxID=1495064 RepID=UPI000A8DDE9D|nr:hypothetical protein [Methylobacter sp. BBA5.1]
MTISPKNQLARFGIDFDRVGAHTSRTLMLEELTDVLSYLSNPNAAKTDYFNAITVDNCLNKRTQANRKITYRDLAKLYTLDPSTTVFRVLLYFWYRDTEARRLLALMCAYCRDSLLRMTAPFILDFSEAAVVDRERLETFIEQQQPDRFSSATLKSTAQNINSSWTQSGHLTGRTRKLRAKTTATPGSVAYALFLGYLTGVRGESLFQTEFAKLLDCSTDQAIELAEEASRRGWIVFKRVGKTIEAVFPHLLTQQEMEWLREQS